MRELQLRPPVGSDWFALLDLANRSLTDVAGATTQELWLENRRSFAESHGEQKHWVAQDATTGELLGYVGVERRSGEDPGMRIFVVTEPAMREDVGQNLLSHALNVARDERASNAWFIEYASDEAFLTFLRGQGFNEARRFLLPDGGEACVMAIRLGD